MKERRSATTSPAHGKRRLTGRSAFQGNEKQLQILKESVSRRTPRFWNQWRLQHPRVTPDLRGLILVGGSLVRHNLARARLNNAVLVRANLALAHLERACLANAELISADLFSVRAEKASLSGANLRGATLHYGDFRRAVCLDGTHLAHADLREANFAGAKMAETALSGADLTKTCFDGADLRGIQQCDSRRDVAPGYNLARRCPRRNVYSSR